MDEDVKRICNKEKLDLVWRVNTEFCTLLRSYEITVKHDHEELPRILNAIEDLRKDEPNLPDRTQLLEIRDNLKGACFSEYVKCFKEMTELKGNFIREHFLEACRTTYDGFESFVEIVNGKAARTRFLKDYEVYLNPNFEFSDDLQVFDTEFFTILFILCVLEKNDGPILDFAVNKALFQAGKFIGKMKCEGQFLNDQKKKAASMPKKDRYSNQVIIDLFYRLDHPRMHPMAVGIKKALSELAEKDKKPKEYVPSISTIKRVLEADGLDKKLKK